MPYSYYPAPSQLSYPPQIQPQQWAAPPALLDPQLPQTLKTAVPLKAVEGPIIAVWLWFCDFHPDREADDFSSLTKKFEKEGFRTIYQLSSNRINVEKLSEWLGIGKGTVDLIIEYADEDIKLLREGKFTMSLSEMDIGEGGSS